MGLFRKLTSISTMGAVDFRSDKERIAMYGRQTRNATRAVHRRAAPAVVVPALVDEHLARAAAFRDIADRMKSPDSAVRAAALAEWQQITGRS